MFVWPLFYDRTASISSLPLILLLGRFVSLNEAHTFLKYIRLNLNAKSNLNSNSNITTLQSRNPTTTPRVNPLAKSVLLLLIEYKYISGEDETKINF